MTCLLFSQKSIESFHRKATCILRRSIYRWCRLKKKIPVTLKYGPVQGISREEIVPKPSHPPWGSIGQHDSVQLIWQAYNKALQSQYLVLFLRTHASQQNKTNFLQWKSPQKNKPTETKNIQIKVNIPLTVYISSGVAIKKSELLYQLFQHATGFKFSKWLTMIMDIL